MTSILLKFLQLWTLGRDVARNDSNCKNIVLNLDYISDYVFYVPENR